MNTCIIYTCVHFCHVFSDLPTQMERLLCSSIVLELCDRCWGSVLRCFQAYTVMSPIFFSSVSYILIITYPGSVTLINSVWPWLRPWGEKSYHPFDLKSYRISECEIGLNTPSLTRHEKRPLVVLSRKDTSLAPPDRSMYDHLFSLLTEEPFGGLLLVFLASPFCLRCDSGRHHVHTISSHFTLLPVVKYSIFIYLFRPRTSSARASSMRRVGHMFYTAYVALFDNTRNVQQ